MFGREADTSRMKYFSTTRDIVFVIYLKVDINRSNKSSPATSVSVCRPRLFGVFLVCPAPLAIAFLAETYFSQPNANSTLYINHSHLLLK